MVDPTNFSTVNDSRWNLEESLIFWMCVAGKPADITARKVDEFLMFLQDHWMRDMWDEPCDSPFILIGWAVQTSVLRDRLERVKMGKYDLLTHGLIEVSLLDAKTVSLDMLERVPGIGPKTARCFLLHSRPDQQYAALDTHILKWLHALGYQNVPKTTPSSGPKYKALEQQFLQLASYLTWTPAELDLTIWKHYAGREIAPTFLFDPQLAIKSIEWHRTVAK